jgi:hypothetical protein
VNVNTTRRGLLRSLAVAGGVASAGCFGDGGETPGTASSETPPVTESTTRSSTAARTDTPPVHTTLCGVCVDVPDLVVVDGPTPEVAPGATVTVSVTFRNPYEFEVSDVEVALDAPDEDWAVDPATVTPGPVSPGEKRQVEWDVTAPDTAAGGYTLSTVTTVRGPQADYTVRTNALTIQVTES